VARQVGGTRAEVVGREAELARLRTFVETGSPRALLLTGEPGVGKTTLWEAAIDAAREQGLRVLSARPSGAEAQLAFEGLIDLLDRVEVAELPRLPRPQRHALEVALLRAEPGRAPPASGAISLGFLNAVRALAAAGRLLIAVDDLQWLDGSSAEVLAFAARRLSDENVIFLLGRRRGPGSGLERHLDGGIEFLDVGPLSLGAIRHVLAERLGLSLPRHLLRRVVDLTQGNPLFSLEVGRSLVERGLPALGEDLPVPDRVEDLFGTRVAGLPAPMRSLLLALDLHGELPVPTLSAIGGVDALEDAVDSGLLSVAGDQVRPFHPLLSASARRESSPAVRRELHRSLAHLVGDEESRARHLALGTKLPERELAGTVAAAAAGASARGARQDAVELAQHALRLTPPEAIARTDRLLELAGYLEAAGEPQRVADLLQPELDGLPAGEARVRALLTLTECVPRIGGDGKEYLDLALTESGSDPRLRAYVLPAMSILLGSGSVERLRDAEAWAMEAVPAARAVGADVERLALDALGWARALRGEPIEDVCRRSRAVSRAAGLIANSAERITAQRLAWRGQVERARALHARLLSLADERGEWVSYALERLHLCELELRAGECETASRLLDEWSESWDRDLLPAPAYERCRALLALARGRAAEVEELAAEVLAISEQSGQRWNWLEALRVRGTAALLAHEPARAVESLRAVWRHTEREGVDEPGVFPVAPELVEALVELGELEEARAVTDRLGTLAKAQRHPWGLASAKRCDALVRFGAKTEEEVAAATLAEAAAAYGELGLRLDRVRTLLLLGRAQRRRKKWAAARSALEQAVAGFDAIDSPGWAEEARTELARVGARRPAPSDRLTPAERRAVELATEGFSNKEIAAALFVTVNTVETHLSHAYAKLGIRSRTQLARVRLPPQ
jgi:DNA-binding CsgD family transcriptional regulator/DNA polymerase III delta prime subunit